ncbi:hypothetical protein EDD21DRAFT_353213 [Dissophora ornata]|nr:hypothetical protein EDD21DRAFT_353213 [Dissophora ornata]
MTSWHEAILSYNFKVEYRPGVMNILPDHLSRLFPGPMMDRHESSRSGTTNAYLHIMQAGDAPRRTVEKQSERTDMLQRVHVLGHCGKNIMVKNIQEDQLNWVKKFPGIIISAISLFLEADFKIKGHSPTVFGEFTPVTISLVAIASL